MNQEGEKGRIKPEPLTASPPRGLMRFVLRLPVVLYRLRLGWVLGERFLMLNHIGRKTGQLRKTVVEVIGIDNGTYYIASGWGYKSNWYQNLLAHPDTTIQIGRKKLEVHAETLPADQGTQILMDYREHHPVAASELSRILGFNLRETPPDKLRAIVQASLPVVALRSQAR